MPIKPYQETCSQHLFASAKWLIVWVPIYLLFGIADTLADQTETKTHPLNKPLTYQDAVGELVKKAASRPTIPKPVKKADKKKSDTSVEQTCFKIGAKLGSVSTASCLSHNLQLSGGESVNHIPLLIKEYPPISPRIPQARILLLGGIHGDEYSSVSVTFKWMHILNKHHSGLFHWRVAPLVNPDGLLRKKSQRMNSRGVDLNRNFPTRNWLTESKEYWIKKTGRDPRRYPGEFPLSEPESQWVSDEIERFRPDVIVSVHAPYALLDFDGPPTTTPEKLGSLYLSLLGTYPGSLGRFVGSQLKIPIITIELSYAGIMPTRTEIDTILMDLIRWVKDHVNNNPSFRSPHPQTWPPLSTTKTTTQSPSHPVSVQQEPQP